jgi:hypothetical protein
MMLSRTLRAQCLRPALSRAAIAKRTVTTDAASAHADKDAVPEVCIFFLLSLLPMPQLIPGLVLEGGYGNWGSKEAMAD